MFSKHLSFEPPRDKTNNVAVRPLKTQISLCIRAQWVDKGPSFLHVDSEDSDQTGRKQKYGILYGFLPNYSLNSSLFLHFATN